MLVANHTVDCAKNIQIYNYAHKVNGTEQLLEVCCVGNRSGQCE